ncbi:MAG: O-antigen ligase family protein [Prosthecobacter sp.]
MDFKAVVLVLLVYFIRPQDWIPALNGVGIVTPIMLVAIGTMYQRSRTLGYKLEFFRTPHDWGMLAYYAYVVYTSPDPTGTFKDAFPLFAFYFVTVQALSTTSRLHTYLKAWMWAVFTLGAFGLLSLIGWDFTGAIPMTQSMQGRLALGTWMHNNPNSLGHTLITAIPLAYFLYYWKKNMGAKIFAVGIATSCFSAIYETQSKGAVVAGFVSVVMSYSFGKSKFVQILLLSAALAGGGAAISLMPRMESMGSLRSDEGIQGRLLAWDQAKISVQNHFTGEGWKSFHAIIKWEKTWISKATHSSYVKIGADLGYPGMFIYIGILWLGVRTLLRAKPEDDELNRCRQCLFTLIISYIVSNWMIDRAYHTEYFLFMAAIGAFHRLALLNREVKENTEELQEVLPWQLPTMPSWLPELRTESISAQNMTFKASLIRPSAIDAVLALCGTWTVFYIWDYVLKNL